MSLSVVVRLVSVCLFACLCLCLWLSVNVCLCQSVCAITTYTHAQRAAHGTHGTHNTHNTHSTHVRTHAQHARRHAQHACAACTHTCTNEAQDGSRCCSVHWQQFLASPQVGVQRLNASSHSAVVELNERVVRLSSVPICLVSAVDCTTLGSELVG